MKHGFHIFAPSKTILQLLMHWYRCNNLSNVIKNQIFWSTELVYSTSSE